MLKRYKDWVLNPVLLKELQWRAHSKRTPWIIFAYLFFLGVLVYSSFVFFGGSSGRFDSEKSLSLFLFLSILQLVMNAFIIPGVTSGLISGEREKQTLHILLTTSLDSRQIILGKWLASLGFMLLLFIASIPLYIIIYGFGGISPSHLAMVLIHLLVTMLFYSSLGIFFSSWIKQTGTATVVTYLSVLLHVVGIAFLVYFSFITQTLVPGNNNNDLSLLLELIMSLHPLFTLLDIFGFMGNLETMIGGVIGFYQFYIVFYLLFTIVLLIAGAYALMPSRFQFLKWNRKL